MSYQSVEQPEGGPAPSSSTGSFETQLLAQHTTSGAPRRRYPELTAALVRRVLLMAGPGQIAGVQYGGRRLDVARPSP